MGLQQLAEKKLMKVLISIPHVFAPKEGSPYSSENEEKRSSKLLALKEATIGNLERHSSRQWVHASLGKAKPVITRELTTINQLDLTIEVHTHPELNQLKTLPNHKNIRITYHNTGKPMDIPFHASRNTLEQADDYDMVGYMEDDIGILDREFFNKIEWMVKSSDEHFAFIPHRCETIPENGDVILSGDPDGGRPDLFWDTGEQIKFVWPTGDKIFYRATNPHSGCWFLTKNQAQLIRRYWEEKNWIATFQLSGPIEQAGSGLLLPKFHIMKPKPANYRFLMVKHYDCLWKCIPSE